MRSWVDQNHTENQNHTEREIDSWLWVEGEGSKIGSWREGSGSSAKLKVHGSKALGRRSVCGFIDRRS